MAALTASLADLSRAVVRLNGREVLRGVTLSVRPGEMLALCGPNGAGKSTLLRALAGLISLASGAATLGGDPVSRLSPPDRARRLAYLAQERRVAWNLPAIELAALGAPGLPPAVALARARSALAEVGAAHLADRGIADLSGGERARVLLARALAVPSPLLLADEPTAGLDPAARLMVLGRLAARARAGQGVVACLHDLGEAARFADRVVVIADGVVAADGAPTQALSPPVLARVFGLDAAWTAGAEGPLLDVRGYSPPA